MALTDKIDSVKGIGPSIAVKFKSLGLNTVSELIDNYPRRYNDFSAVTKIIRLKPGTVSIKAEVKQVKGRYVRGGLHITEAVVSDDSDSVRLVWFNQPYREKSLKTDVNYFISGNFGLNNRRLSILNPAIELEQDFPVNTARIIPVYRETKGLNSLQIRRAIREVLPDIRKLKETLPKWLVEKEKLMSFSGALEAIHFPGSMEELDKAHRRLGFEEVFSLSLASLLNKNELAREHSINIAFEEKLARSFVAKLPFNDLTPDQRRVVWRIYQDLDKTQPMNRMVEGDVGSGKTVVATMAALMVMNAGYQAAFMAPTELLARQHAQTIKDLLEPLKMGDKVVLLVGSMSESQKKIARKHISDGSAGFIIGTHALIQEKVKMNKLGLVVIDEQQRFGVDQRKSLIAKAGQMPHLLSLTATPIPRTLALTLYGELDISILHEKPSNRLPIITEIIRPTGKERLYVKIDELIGQGEQVFVVCPLISDSKLMATASAEAIYKELTTKYFKHRRLGLLHGRIKVEAKNDIMQKFVEGKIDILVSTTVIEVGVDVPNATVMIIEAAERFGLAQLHQLRGRVGRSHQQGYCYLILSDNSPPTARLRALLGSSDGFKLAELDLNLRGPGAIYGTLQHGELDLRIAKLSDTKLIAEARDQAAEFIEKKEKISHYKELFNRVSRLRSVTNLN